MTRGCEIYFIAFQWRFYNFFQIFQVAGLKVNHRSLVRRILLSSDLPRFPSPRSMRQSFRNRKKWPKTKKFWPPYRLRSWLLKTNKLFPQNSVYTKSFQNKNTSSISQCHQLIFNKNLSLIFTYKDILPKLITNWYFLQK